MRLDGRVVAGAMCGLFAGLGGCGARSELGELVVPEADAGGEDAGGHTGRRDAGVQDGGHGTPRDAPGNDGERPDRSPPDAPPDGPTTSCVSDPACDDGVACTVDYCNKATGACEHTPVDTSCSPGSACFPTMGCAPGSFADSHEALFSLVLPAGDVALIGSTGSNKFDDIALSPDGTLYGVTAGSLFTIAAGSGYATVVASVDRELEGLDFGDDGTLYGAGSTALYTMDPGSGALTLLAEFPTGSAGEIYYASGDVAVLGTTLYATATSGGTAPDVLVAVDLTASAPVATTAGSIGRGCVWGLAAYEGVLYGFTCDGDVLSIDPATGVSAIVASYPGDTFYGATAR